MTEGNIARWTAKPGDAVREGAVLLEIETDKALVEVTAPGDGVLAAILAPDGAERVKGGVVIGGSAQINNPGTANVTINQFSDKAIINWHMFNIGVGEKTTFVQPKPRSR